jgi:MFS family permease
LAVPLVGVLVLRASLAEMGYLSAAGVAPSLVPSGHTGVYLGRYGRRHQAMLIADICCALLRGSIPAAFGAHVDAGLAFLTPTLATVIQGLTEAGNKASFDHGIVVVPLAAGAALLAAFAFDARQNQRPPLIDVRLLTERTFATSTNELFLSSFALYRGLLLLPAGPRARRPSRRVPACPPRRRDAPR